ncbi:MAG: hypothetical protein HPY83_11720 [Anaerolineae bacterium]|nr:hypothetical protein [Anaerolineae bacterium]
MSDDAAALEYSVSEPRVSIMRGFRHFYVSGRASMPRIEEAAGGLIDRLYAAYGRARHGVQLPAILILSYGMPDETGEFDLTAGLNVTPVTEAVGEAQVEEVSDSRCASVLLRGRLRDLKEAHEALNAFVQDKGLQYGPGFREWYLYWEGEDSANNVTLITYDLAG